MIDKSIRQHYKIQGGKRRRFLHGSQGAAASTGRTSSPSTSGGGGGGGGWDPGVAAREQAAAQAAAQRAEADRQTRVADQAAAAQAAAQAAAAANRAAEQQAAEGKVDVGFQEALKKTEDARQREEEFLKTGDYDVYADTTLQPGPKVDVKDIMGEVDDPGSVSYDPTYKTPEEIRTLSQDPDYGQFFRQPTVVEKPKTGIGGILKNVAMAVIPGLLPAKAATAYRLAKAGYDIKKGKGILGQAFKKVEPRLAKFKVPGTGTKKLVKHEPVDRDGIQQAITGEEGLLTEGAKTLGLTEDQREQYKLMQNKMKTALDQGSYTNQQGQVIQLNEQQMDQLQNYIDRLDSILQMVLQTAAHGGRIDGPLMGGSRYI